MIEQICLIKIYNNSIFPEFNYSIFGQIKQKNEIPNRYLQSGLLAGVLEPELHLHVRTQLGAAVGFGGGVAEAGAGVA